MERPLNLTFKFNVDPKADLERLSSNVAFQIASTSPAFNLDEIKNISAGMFNYHITDSDVLNLKQISTKISESEFELKDDSRNAILKNTEPQKLRDIIAKLERKDSIQRHIASYIQGTQQSLELQTPQQLVQTLRISKWFKDTEYNIPSEEEVLSRLQQHELLRPFYALTKYFKGRKKELAWLDDYVDWLPKEGFLSNSRAIVRNLIHWHDKPPLLLLGIGGIGKSSIIAKFILQNVTEQSRGVLPFIYFDFDRPGVSPSKPYMLASDALRQLAIQFPSQRQILLTIRQQLIETFKNEDSKGSRRSERHLLYDMMSPYLSDLNQLGKPIVVVFDSFEEVEYRISKSQMHSLFDFLEELSSQIPRIRFVFAGRSEAGFERRKVEKLVVSGFDEESAIGFLESIGVTNAEIRKELFAKIGGNPLSLHLAADLVKKQRASRLDDIRTGSFMSFKLDEKLIQKQLVERNLNHIHDEDVRKIAVPGMLVRRIDPYIITEVLAGPCGVKNVTLEKSQEIFEHIEKETFLAERTGDSLIFRQDLRVALNDLILKKDPEKSAKIHDNAVKFHERSNDAASVAEYLYHRLKRGDAPEILYDYYNDEVATYLDYSISELPIGSQLIISAIKGGLISERKTSDAQSTDWESYAESLLTSAFSEGDEQTLRRVQAEVNSRKERRGIVLLLLEAKLYLRLSDEKKFLEINEKVRLHHAFTSHRFQNSKFTIYYLEYRGDFKHAARLIEEFQPRQSEEFALWLEYYLTSIRLSYRVKDWSKARFFVGNCKRFVSGSTEFFNQGAGFVEALPKPYRALFSKHDVLRSELFTQFLDSLHHIHLPAERFRSVLESAGKTFSDLNHLEKHVHDDQGILLHKLSEPGIFQIVLQDVLLYYELIGAPNHLSNNSQNLSVM